MSLPAAILLLMLLGIVLSIVLGPLNALPTPGRRRRGGERADLEAQREAKYQEIRDAELDFQTGKLSVQDHEAVDSALRREAVEILNRIQALDQAEQSEDAKRAVEDAKRADAKRSRVA
jgi:hypothetical protein